MKIDRTGSHGSTNVNTGANLGLITSLSTLESSLDEQAQRNRTDIAEKAEAKYIEKQKKANPEFENLSDEEIKAQIKKREEKGEDLDSGARGDSRDSVLSKLTGSLSDIGNIVAGNNRGGGQDFYIDEAGEYKQRTCFVAGTLITTRDGFTPIEDVKEGQFVLAINEKTGEKSYKRVQQTYIRTADRIFKLIYENGAIIETTATHPFYISGRGWVEAQNLEVGYRSITSGDNALAIKEIVVDKKNETVYNFTVEGEHNYFVGKNGVLVHNENYGIADNSKIYRTEITEKDEKLLDDIISEQIKPRQVGESESVYQARVVKELRDLSETMDIQDSSLRNAYIGKVALKLGDSLAAKKRK